MRIAYCITGLGVGGAESMLWKLLKHEPLLRNGVVFSLSGDGPLAERIRSLGMEVEELGLRRGRPSPAAFRRLTASLKSGGFDLVSTWMYHADFFGGLAAWRAHLPVVWGIRASDLDPRTTAASTRLLVRACAWLSHVVPRSIISCSLRARELHVRLGYDASKLIVIPNGFDTSTFVPSTEASTFMRRQLGIPEEARIVGHIARFDAMKNQSGFLEAAAEVLGSGVDAHFVMAGTGVDPGNQALRALITSGKLEGRVHLLGLRTDVSGVMPALDVLVSPSLYGEGFPNVVGEAMACGVPCVVTDVGDSAMVVGDTGVTVPIGDTAAIARGVLRLCNEPPEARLLRSRLTRQRVLDNFSIESVAKRYVSAFQTARRVSS